MASASQLYDQAEAKGRLIYRKRFSGVHSIAPRSLESGGVFSAAGMLRVCSNLPYLAVVASRSFDEMAKLWLFVCMESSPNWLKKTSIPLFALTSRAEVRAVATESGWYYKRFRRVHILSGEEGI